MKILLFFIFSLAASEIVCRLPIVFHKFYNCPILIRRTDPHPDPPSSPPFEFLCDNEGTCKKTGFYTSSKNYNEELNQTYVSSGVSYEGFCACKVRTAEFLSKRTVGEEDCLELKVHNIWFKFCENNITMNDGILLPSSIECKDCVPQDNDLLHIFIYFIYNEDTGYTTIQLYINANLVWVIEDIFYKVGDNIVTFYGGDTYQYALYEEILTKKNMEILINTKFDREPDDEYCIDEYTVSEMNFDDIVKGDIYLHILFWSMVGFMFIIMILTILCSYGLKYVWTKFKIN